MDKQQAKTKVLQLRREQSAYAKRWGRNDPAIEQQLKQQYRNEVSAALVRDGGLELEQIEKLAGIRLSSK